MTPKRFEQCLTAIGWSMRHVAGLLGVSENTARRWAAGLYPVPENVGKWLETIAAVHRKNPPPDIA